MKQEGDGVHARLHGLLILFVLCLSAYIQLTVATRTVLANPLVADSGRYFSYAYNLENFGVYSSQVTWDPQYDEGALQPDAIRSPAYPAFLLLVARPEPSREWAGKVAVAQALLGVASVFLVYLLARLLLAPLAATGVAMLTALSPHLAAITPEILTEALFTTSLLAATLAAAFAVKSRGTVWLVVAGALWGVASLVRPTTELFPLLVAVATLAVASLRRYFAQTSIFVLSFALTIAPWFIRNQNVDLRPTSESLTVNFLHHGSYPDFMYKNRPETFGFPYRHDPDSPQISRSAASALARIGQNFTSDPATYARWYLVGKPIAFLSWNIVNGQGDIFTAEPTRSPFLEDRKFAILRDAMYALHWPLMVLGLFGGAAAWLRPAWLGLSGSALACARLVSAILGYGIVLHMIGAPFPRYGIPFRPLCYLLAMLPMAAVCGRLLGPIPASGRPETLTQAGNGYPKHSSRRPASD